MGRTPTQKGNDALSTDSLTSVTERPTKRAKLVLEVPQFGNRGSITPRDSEPNGGVDAGLLLPSTDGRVFGPGATCLTIVDEYNLTRLGRRAGRPR
jgi:hypothetical protein